MADILDKDLKITTLKMLKDLTAGHISGKDKNSNSKRYMHPNVHSSIIYNSQDMEAT